MSFFLCPLSLRRPGGKEARESHHDGRGPQLCGRMPGGVGFGSSVRPTAGSGSSSAVAMALRAAYSRINIT